jgi:hypothetical protein
MASFEAPLERYTPWAQEAAERNMAERKIDSKKDGQSFMRVIVQRRGVGGST